MTGKFKSVQDVPQDRARTRHYASSHTLARHGEAGAEAETFSTIEEVKKIAGDYGLPMDSMSLAWVSAQKGVASVIAGARNPKQASRNAASGDLILPDEVVERLWAVTEQLKKTMGENADLWQHESRIF